QPQHLLCRQGTEALGHLLVVVEVEVGQREWMVVAARALELPAGKLVERPPVLVPRQEATRPPVLLKQRTTTQVQVAREGERQHGNHHGMPSHSVVLQVQALKAFRVRVTPAPLSAARSFSASLDATATLQRHP